MLRKLRKPAVILAASAVALLGLAGAASASTAQLAAASSAAHASMKSIQAELQAHGIDVRLSHPANIPAGCYTFTNVYSGESWYYNGTYVVDNFRPPTNYCVNNGGTWTQIHQDGTNNCVTYHNTGSPYVTDSIVEITCANKDSQLWNLSANPSGQYGLQNDWWNANESCPAGQLGFMNEVATYPDLGMGCKSSTPPSSALFTTEPA